MPREGIADDGSIVPPSSFQRTAASYLEQSIVRARRGLFALRRHSLSQHPCPCRMWRAGNSDCSYSDRYPDRYAYTYSYSADAYADAYAYSDSDSDSDSYSYTDSRQRDSCLDFTARSNCLPAGRDVC